MGVQVPPLALIFKEFLMDDNKQYIVGALLSSKESAIDLAQRLANKEGLVYYIGEAGESYHPIEKEKIVRKFTFSSD